MSQWLLSSNQTVNSQTIIITKVILVCDFRLNKPKVSIFLQGYPNSQKLISIQIIEGVQSKLRYRLLNNEFHQKK